MLDRVNTINDTNSFINNVNTINIDESDMINNLHYNEHDIECGNIDQNQEHEQSIQDKVNIYHRLERIYYIILIIPCCGITYVLIDLQLSFIFKISILFVSFIIILWVFPNISRSLYSRPLYIGDIENSRFEIAYINTMNFVLALGCAVLFENWVIQKLIENKNLLEITALVGGNITFFGTIQNYFAKLLLSVCHRCKLYEEELSRRNSHDQDELLDSEISVTTSSFTDNPLNIIHSPLRRGRPYAKFCN